MCTGSASAYGCGHNGHTSVTRRNSARALAWALPRRNGVHAWPPRINTCTARNSCSAVGTIASSLRSMAKDKKNKDKKDKKNKGKEPAEDPADTPPPEGDNAAETADMAWQAHTTPWTDRPKHLEDVRNIILGSIERATHSQNPQPGTAPCTSALMRRTTSGGIWPRTSDKRALNGATCPGRSFAFCMPQISIISWERCPPPPPRTRVEQPKKAFLPPAGGARDTSPPPRRPKT